MRDRGDGGARREVWLTGTESNLTGGSLRERRGAEGSARTFRGAKRRAPRSFAVKKQKTRVCNFSAEARNDGGQAGAKGDGDGQGRP